MSSGQLISSTSSSSEPQLGMPGRGSLVRLLLSISRPGRNIAAASSHLPELLIEVIAVIDLAFIAARQSISFPPYRRPGKPALPLKPFRRSLLQPTDELRY